DNIQKKKHFELQKKINILHPEGQNKMTIDERPNTHVAFSSWEQGEEIVGLGNKAQHILFGYLRWLSIVNILYFVPENSCKLSTECASIYMYTL
ncbi:hypothetical protein ACJX0J_018824, partial [Zea mays]